MVKLPRILSEIRGWAHMSGQKIPLVPEKTEDRKFSCTKHPELFKNYSEICELIEAKGGSYFPCLRTAAKDGIVVIDIDCHNGKKPEEAKEQYEEMIGILGSGGYYAERSFSGNGYHILTYAPGVDALKADNSELQVEAWNRNQFVMLTGDVLVNCDELDNKTDEVLRILELFDLSSAKMKKSKVEVAKAEAGFNSVVQEGARNNTLFEYAVTLAKSGKTGDILYSLVLDKNNSFCLPPLERKDVHGICERAEKYVPENGKKPRLTYRLLEEELYAMDISVHFNELTREMEVRGNVSEFNPDTIAEDISGILYSELGDRYTSISETTIFKYLKIIAGLGRYHPVVDFFEQLGAPSVDVQDSLDRLYEILGVTDGFEKTLIAKWLLQCVAMVFNTDQQRPYGADGILVLQGAQGIGKTSFAEALGMNEPGFVNVGIRLNENDKDTFRRAVTCWIAELGELDETFKKSDIEMLKAFITQPRDMYRLPYDRSDLKYNRRSSFIATCNEPEFLVDTTGNRRFWSVHVDKIDLDALRAYDFKELWAGIYELWRIEGKQSFRLSREEQKTLNERNMVFEKPVKSETEIRDILAYTKDNESFKYSWVTATEFMNAYPELRNHSYRSQDIGKALKKFTLEEKSEHNVTYRYLPMPKSRWI